MRSLLSQSVDTIGTSRKPGEQSRRASNQSIGTKWCNQSNEQVGSQFIRTQSNAGPWPLPSPWYGSPCVRTVHYSALPFSHLAFAYSFRFVQRYIKGGISTDISTANWNERMKRAGEMNQQKPEWHGPYHFTYRSSVTSTTVPAISHRFTALFSPFPRCYTVIAKVETWC